MRLTFKIAIILTFCSLLLYGFTGQHTFDTIVPDNSGVMAAKPGKNNVPVKITQLPKEVKESSGIEEAGKPGIYYTHNDANNAPELYKVDEKGNLLSVIQVPDAENVDWEDLTRDDKGNIYIGDTGNNSNKRLKLRIYKFKPESPGDVQEITFEYADRKNGTAGKAHFEFDCEAIFWHQKKLYLVTKDRADGVEAKLYELPDQPGHYDARLISKYAVNDPVTSADISPDGKTLLLLGEGKLHLFHPTAAGNFLGGTMETLNLGQVGQTEAAVFTGNKSIVITSEEGEMYRFTL